MINILAVSKVHANGKTKKQTLTEIEKETWLENKRDSSKWLRLKEYLTLLVVKEMACEVTLKYQYPLPVCCPVNRDSVQLNNEK